MDRASGILLPISSLPSKYGIGTFSKEAYEFADKLVEAGQSYWQILPLGPTGYGDSPYQPFSTFAGNPYLIDLETLIEEELLTKEECDGADLVGHPNYVEYGKLYENRFPLLRKAYERSHISENPDFQAFMRENEWWVKDYALFMAVKKCFAGKPWSEWAQDIRMRWGYSLDYYYSTYPEEIEFYEFLQFKFFEQWTKLKAYVNEIGLKIIGDLPIYVAFDSADAWSCPQLFQFDEENYPVQVAGVPPDAFSETGQLWGNPLYRWDYHKQTGYDWWIRRMRHAKKLYDVVRIDHFRGFDEYFAVPALDETAMNGHWEKGPGIELFEVLKREIPDMEVIAEDLGVITPSVEKMVADSGFPNMHVLEFGFVPEDPMNTHMPYRYDTNSVVYTGTHDNETLKGWFDDLEPERVAYIEKILETFMGRRDTVCWDIIHFGMMSSANLCVVPMQDLLMLGNEARMNHPSTTGANWKWRMSAGTFDAALIKRVRSMTKKAFRFFGEDEEVTEEESVVDKAAASVEKVSEKAEETAAAVKNTAEGAQSEMQEAAKPEKKAAAVQTATENNNAAKGGKKAYHGKRNRGARKH